VVVHGSAVSVPVTPQSSHWSLALRIGFRFSFVYFGLYCLTTQIFTSLLPIPNFEVPELDTLPPLRPMVFWVAAHLFHVSTPLVYTGSGSGDKTFDWVYAFCLLVFSLLAVLVWSSLDRRRANYAALHKWFRLFVRLCLAGQLFTYGMYKVVPLQMSFPFTRLVEPYGDFSPMGVLWAFIGASPAYECFAGSAEMLGGILLFLPRTTLLGALVCLADMAQVFVLNMTYDVPVKLLSFHLILLAVILIAPDLSRLARFFLLDRAPAPSSHPALFASPRANRLAFAAQLLFGICLVSANVRVARTVWYTQGDGRPKPPLYGIWEVSEFSTDGQSRPPLLSDHDRWRRAIVFATNRIRVQRMDDSMFFLGLSLDPATGSLALTKSDDKNWKAEFRFLQPSPDELTLDGDMNGHKVSIRFHLMDTSRFLLPSRGFHWVQEYPFNR